jgi:hypothetical protein
MEDKNLVNKSVKVDKLISNLREIPRDTRKASLDVYDLCIAAADRLANDQTHIAVLQQEIDRLREQVPRWIPVEERLPELQNWGASKVVLGIVQNESGYPPPNPCFCVYLGNQQWTIRGRMATITHWMPLPEPPEVE